MFMDGFRYVIASTQIVQTIMKKNKVVKQPSLTEKKAEPTIRRVPKH